VSLTEKPEESSRLTQEQIERIKQEVVNRLKPAANEPFKVSIMGQTGVGKSSLLNALFNTNLKTDPVRPSTKKIERVIVKGKSEHELWFYDLPGIGESQKDDEKYLQQYVQQLIESDVVLWAIHADSRSVAFDLDALRQILNSFDRERQAMLMSKLTFVLTKADTLSPPPWILAKMDDYGVFAPGKTTRNILEEKASYYQEVFLHPYGNLIVSHTYNDCDFKVNDPRLSSDKYSVFYQGFLDSETLTRLKSPYAQDHPYTAVFDRLYDNYQVIPCSSLFRFNLTQLMLVIVNKLGRETISRFNNFVDDDALNKVSFSKAKEYCNLVVFDPKKNKKLFDLTEAKI
jgi:predicted GTPase